MDNIRHICEIRIRFSTKEHYLREGEKKCILRSAEPANNRECCYTTALMYNDLPREIRREQDWKRF